MATLEKRITELESRVANEHRVLMQMPKDDGTYEPVPDGFQGTVRQVQFIDSPNALKERTHADN